MGRIRFKPLVPKRGYLFRRDRFTKVVTLCFIALFADKKIELRLRFHSFSDYIQIETVGHRDNSRDDGRIIRVAGNIPNKGLVYFDLIDRQPFEIAQ